MLFNIGSKAQYARKYPPLKIGSLVREHLKGDNVSSKKGWMPKWSDRIYEVEKIENGMYYLKNNPINRGVLRHDLLRIDDEQRIPDDVKASNIEKIESAKPKATKRLNTKTRFFQVR